MSRTPESELSLAITEDQIFSLEEIHRFMVDCMVAVGTPPDQADSLASCLTEADYRGRFCHGMNRLSLYINEVKEGACNPKASPNIIKESLVTAWVDGNNSLGVTVGEFCMHLAIKKAQKSGIGWVVAKGSNRMGLPSYYTKMALKEGLLGMTFSNSSPLVIPTRGTSAALGSNPIAVAAPASHGDSFDLDISTSVVDIGKIELLNRKKLPVPVEWADQKTGAVFPIGGQDPSLNFKGYTLCMMVEVLTGILSGSAYGPHVRKYGDPHQTANFGQCFIAINPEYFAPGFEGRLSDLMDYLRNMEPIESDKPVLVPGDKEKEHMALVEREGGIRYVRNQLQTCFEFARKLKVKPLTPIS